VIFQHLYVPDTLFFRGKNITQTVSNMATVTIHQQ